MPPEAAHFFEPPFSKFCIRPRKRPIPEITDNWPTKWTAQNSLQHSKSFGKSTWHETVRNWGWCISNNFRQRENLCTIFDVKWCNTLTSRKYTSLPQRIFCWTPLLPEFFIPGIVHKAPYHLEFPNFSHMPNYTPWNNQIL